MATVTHWMDEMARAWQRLHDAGVASRCAHAHALDRVKEIYRRRLTEIATSAQGDGGGPANLGLDGGVAWQAFLGQVDPALRWALLGWDDPAWDEFVPSMEAPFPTAVRIGSLAQADRLPLGEVPALIPLVGDRPVFFRGPESKVRTALATIALRAVAASPPGMVRPVLVDPLHMGQGLFSLFNAQDTKLIGGTVWWEPKEIEGQLAALQGHIASVLHTRLRRWHTSLETYNEQTPEMAIAYRLLVLADFPAHFSAEMTEQVIRIIEKGAPAGVYVVAGINPKWELTEQFELFLQRSAQVYWIQDNHLVLPDSVAAASHVALDEVPSPARVDRIVGKVANAAKEAQTAVPFERIKIPEAEQWQGSAIKELRVPVGITDTGEVQEFIVGHDATIHNALIGGRIGSGKSNLLNVLIMQLGLKYSVDELELYLADFAPGAVTFQSYPELPHLGAFALDAEREFGVSILRHLQREMERRGRLFQELDQSIDSLTSYRQRTAEKLPRLVLIMDEFQVLFTGDDWIPDVASEILEDLVRRGRKYGIHIILCSQSPTIRSWYGSRIYPEIALRIAFRCAPEVGREILGDKNDGAETLEREGEGIYNAGTGAVANNVRFRAAWLERAERKPVVELIQAIARGRTAPSPMIFDPKKPAQLEANPELLACVSGADQTSRRAVAAVWLGEAIEIKPPTAAALDRRADSNLLAVGGGSLQTPGATNLDAPVAHVYGWLAAALIGLAAQQAPEEARFVVADLTWDGSAYHDLFEGIGQELPHTVEVVRRSHMLAALAQLAAEVQERVAQEDNRAQAVYVLVPSLRLAPGPAEMLAEIAAQGPSVGIHVLAHADTLRDLTDRLGPDALDLFSYRVGFQITDEDSLSLFETHSVTRPPRDRAYFRHRYWAPRVVEKIKPYPVPDPDTLHTLLAAVHAKWATRGDRGGKTSQ